MGLFDFLKKKELQEIGTLKEKLEKYKPIIDIEKEAELKTEELKKLVDSENAKIKDIEENFTFLKNNYEDSLEIFKKLKKEVSIYESKLDLIEFGVYEPVFEFDKSEEYREEQKRIISLQKEMIKDETAATCSTNWTIDGSVTKGRASTKRNIKLILRAFNGECNSLIAKVKWNNVNQMKERIKKVSDKIKKK